MSDQIETNTGARETKPGAAQMAALDRWGLAISGACLVHCLALPLVSALLPLLTASLPGHEWIHAVMLGLALPISGAALLRGYRSHRQAWPLLLGVVGLALIALARFVPGELSEAGLTSAGGLLLIAAHLINWRRHA